METTRGNQGLILSQQSLFSEAPINVLLKLRNSKPVSWEVNPESLPKLSVLGSLIIQFYFSVNSLADDSDTNR